MKKFILLLLFPVLLFAQSIYPPIKGWSRIYVDTLNYGTHGSFSYNYGTTTNMKSVDTTDIIHATDVWGMSTLFVKTTVVGAQDVSDSLAINFLGYQPNLQSFGTTTNSTTAALVDTINGNYYGYNQFISLAALTYWTVFDDYVFVVGSRDTVIVELWQLIK